jgi:hypothetical protein
MDAVLVAFLALCLATVLPVQSQPTEVTVSTLAGLKGVWGTVNGTGTDARFNNPNAVSSFPNGDIIVADTGNEAIRLVTAAGVVSTFAGLMGSQGMTDGTGASARFSGVSGLCALPNGDVVVADTWNSAIRYITAVAVVTTLAGLKGTLGTADGIGTGARFNNPRGVSVLANGDFVVADTGNHAIRYVTSGGVVSTLAGLKGTSGSADGTGTAAGSGALEVLQSSPVEILS